MKEMLVQELSRCQDTPQQVFYAQWSVKQEETNIPVLLTRLQQNTVVWTR